MKDYLRGRKLTPVLAKEIHEEILRNMSPERKQKMIDNFWKLAAKLQELNDRKLITYGKERK